MTKCQLKFTPELWKEISGNIHKLYVVINHKLKIEKYTFKWGIKDVGYMFNTNVMFVFFYLYKLMPINEWRD